MPAPAFDAGFRNTLAELLHWRRDVRHFLTDPVDAALVQRLLRQAMRAPSVGLSQPWRWVLVEQPARRQAVEANFAAANAAAAARYQGEQATRYAALKLEGLRQAPVHLAVFADPDPGTGHGLGRQTMPGTLIWSVVMAIHTLWLAARAEGLGLGWVSILDPAPLNSLLDVPPHWTPIAYLCLGWPERASESPLLEEAGWEQRSPVEGLVFRR
ncbi:MAG: 5,6-dimethylbenzimidazole synthase [Bryobacteraceae bacterium]|nr:5,6-dimethylbenzimidazole synthase [Bryobacteraceae bacterium]